MKRICGVVSSVVWKNCIGEVSPSFGERLGILWVG